MPLPSPNPPLKGTVDKICCGMESVIDSPDKFPSVGGVKKKSTADQWILLQVLVQMWDGISKFV